jgi:hypothetical protein
VHNSRHRGRVTSHHGSGVNSQAKCPTHIAVARTGTSECLRETLCLSGLSPLSPRSLATNSGVRFTRQVQPDGTSVDCNTPVEGVGPLHDGKKVTERQSTKCVLRGGVDWTIYSVYKIACDCKIPKAVADGRSHTVKFNATRGLVQIAGVVLW